MSRISGDSQAEAISPIHRIFYASQSDTVRLGQRIGTGAEGEVYEIQGKATWWPRSITSRRRRRRPRSSVVLSRLGNERLFNLSAWPVSTLRDAPDGEVVGFVMKKISQAEEVHALHSPKSRLQKFPEASWAFLIYVAANIARAVAAIHEHGLVIGDVNPKTSWSRGRPRSTCSTSTASRSRPRARPTAAKADFRSTLRRNCRGSPSAT